MPDPGKPDEREEIPRDSRWRCPQCHVAIEYHSHPDGRWPKVGDITMCWDCTALLTYEKTNFGFLLRRCTPEEIDQTQARFGEDISGLLRDKANGASARGAVRQWRRRKRTP